MKALARHEHYLSHKIGLKEGMHVLDVGCGVGGPAREIATFSGCSVVGLNNNNYQITRANAYTKKAGLEDRVSFAQGDFMVSCSYPRYFPSQIKIPSISYSCLRATTNLALD